MPNRILRDGILSSDAVCSLNWAEETFYRRLFSVVDDHGRFHASPKLLRSACYPLQIDKVSDPDIGKWLSACETAGLVRVYPASDGKRYLQVMKFGQQVRSKSRFPEPLDDSREQLLAIASNGSQPTANEHLGVCVFEDVVVGDIAAPRAPPASNLLADIDKQVAKDFLALRKSKRAPLTQTALDGIVRELPKAGITLEAALRFCCEKGWQSFKADWYFNALGEQKSNGIAPPQPRRPLTR